MNILKKIVSFIMCGTLMAAIPAPLNSATASARPSVSHSVDSIIEQNKELKLPSTYMNYAVDKAETAKYKNKVVYYLHTKLDYSPFDPDDPSHIYTPMDENILNIVCTLENPNGTYTSVDIIGFKQAQYNKCYLVFPKNGTYLCKIYTLEVI